MTFAFIDLLYNIFCKYKVYFQKVSIVMDKSNDREINKFTCKILLV